MTTVVEKLAERLLSNYLAIQEDFIDTVYCPAVILISSFVVHVSRSTVDAAIKLDG